MEGAPLGPRPFSFDTAMASGCAICNHLVMNMVIHVAQYMDVKRKRSVTPTEVDEFMEHACNPYNVAGAWIRRIAFLVVPNEEDTNEDHPQVHFDVRVLKDYTKCKRTCVTVQEICEDLLSSQYFDDFPNRVASLAQQSPLLMDENAPNLLRAYSCYKLNVCRDKEDIVEKFNRDLNTPPYFTRDDIVQDSIEWIDPEQLHVELTVYETQKHNNVEIFTREEINRLHRALADNDRDAAAKIDSKINLLSSEEFIELRSLAMEERLRMAEDERKLKEEKRNKMLMEKKVELEEKQKRGEDVSADLQELVQAIASDL